MDAKIEYDFKVIDYYEPESAYVLLVQEFRPMNLGYFSEDVAPSWFGWAEFPDTIGGYTEAQDSARARAEDGFPTRIVKLLDPDRLQLVEEAAKRREEVVGND